jgi:hypothetical protein
MSLSNDCILYSNAENASAITSPVIGSGGSIGGTINNVQGRVGNGSESPAGTIDYIAYTRAGVNINPDALLFRAWINTPWSITNGVIAGSASTLHRFFDWYASNNDRVTCQFVSNRLEFAVVVGGGFIFPTFTTNITWSANTDTFIQVAWDRTGLNGDTFRFYINGVKVANSALTIGTQATAGGNTHIHNIFFGGSPLNNFEGVIDEYMFFNNPTELMIKKDFANRYNKGFAQNYIGVV